MKINLYSSIKNERKKKQNERMKKQKVRMSKQKRKKKASQGVQRGHKPDSTRTFFLLLLVFFWE